MQSSTSSSPSSPNLDMKTCSPAALASFLYSKRFQGNLSECQTFLKQVGDALEVTGTSQNSIGMVEEDQSPTKVNENVYGTPLLTTPLETSLLNPRGGKCSIQFYPGFLVATKLNKPNVPFNRLVLPAAAVSHIIFFAKAEDYKLMATLGKNNSAKSSKKVPGAHLVLLRMKKGISVNFQGKWVTEQICFALSWTKGIGPTGPTNGTECKNWVDATAAWRTVLESSLGHRFLTSTCQVQAQEGTTADNKLPFLSYQEPNQSTTTGGMPFVKCYNGVHDGILFPMREGLLFYKPPKFLPRSELASIACGRGNSGGSGQSSSRYVDMVIKQEDGTIQEFTNIQREELSVLNEYIHQILIPAMQTDAKKAGNTGKKEDSKVKNEDETEDEAIENENDEEEEDEDESDDDDENFVDEESENGDSESDNDNNDNSNDDHDLEEDDVEDGFEIVDDEFAKELARAHKGKSPSESPRASRSNKRKTLAKESIKVELNDHEDRIGDNDEEINDDDFEVVVQVESSTESENEDNGASPPKKFRH